MNFHHLPVLGQSQNLTHSHRDAQNEVFNLLQRGETAAALTLLCDLLERDPNNLMARFFRAQLFQENNHLEAALIDLETAIAIAPSYALCHFARGQCLIRLQRLDEALEAFLHATQGTHPEPEAWFHIGNIHMDQHKFPAAIEAYRAFITSAPDNLRARVNLVVALKMSGAYEAAIAEAKDILECDPKNVKALETLAVMHMELGDFAASRKYFASAKEIEPNSINAWLGEGQIYVKGAKYQEALECFKKLEELYPDSHIGYLNSGQAHILSHSYKEAVLDYEKVLTKENYPSSAIGDLVHVKRQICDWNDLSELQDRAIKGLQEGKLTAFPFNMLSWTNDPILMRNAAELFNRKMHPLQSDLEQITRQKIKDRKIRIGYFSADFSEHATMILMGRMFELHDKSKFELFGFSFGPEKMDHMRIRAEMAFDQFIDARPLTDRAVALLSRYFEIDIAIDLKGYTTHSRPNIFAYRAAPIQISYLGFPGTMGATYMDYIIADEEVIPAELEAGYTEKVLRLPRCYQVNDETRKAMGRPFTRAELGLPEDAFVFCSFNNNYKIDPTMFDIWCRLLKRVPKSVLWIMADSEFAKDNLIKEAGKRGIEENRLIFTPRCNQADHISRQKQGDLLLDTFPCNAHTTASDALFAGLPLLTLRGETFAARVAGSILTSAGLSELITDSYEAYEETAFALANDPDRLKKIKAKIGSEAIRSTQLYNTTSFVKDYEELLLQVAADGGDAA